MHMRTFKTVLGLAVALVILVIVLVIGNESRKRVERLELAEQELEDTKTKIRKTCSQQATLLAVLSKQLQRGDDVAKDAKWVLSYGSPAIWLCTGDWPTLEILLERDPVVLQTALEALVIEIDPDRQPLSP